MDTTQGDAASTPSTRTPSTTLAPDRRASSGERRQHLHGVDLSLPGQPDRGAHRERQARVSGERDVEAGKGRGIQFPVKLARTILRDGVGDGIPLLDVHSDGAQLLDQPVLCCAVRFDIGEERLVAGVASQVTEHRSLQQAHLAGGVAGRPRAHGSGLEHERIDAETGEHACNGDPGDSRTHDHDVDVGTDRERIGLDRRRGLLPVRGHARTLWAVEPVCLGP